MYNIIEKGLIQSIKKLNFTIAKFTFHLLLDSPINKFTYLGSTLRGGFGTVLKNIVCVEYTKTCKSCFLKDKCIYAYIFETPKIDKFKVSYNLSEYPHPYIIEPSVYNFYFSPQNKISFDLVLVGNAINFLPYFIVTFQELGKIGIGKNKRKYVIEKVEDAFNGKIIFDKPHSNYSPSNLTIKRFSDIIEEVKNYNEELLTLKFISPTRIVNNNELTSEITFYLFIKNLLRRVSLLSQIHCDGFPDLPYSLLLEMASEVKTIKSDIFWKDWERYSSRQKRKINLGGFVGEISFGKGWYKFAPLIKLGEYIHIGKGTSFGLGKYIMK